MIRESWIEEGSLPWQPTPDAELVETLHHYDMPLIGVYTSQGHLWLFWCAEGQVGDWSVWGYVPIEDEELQLLRGSEDVFEAVNAVRRRHVPSVVAISHEGQGLLRAAEVEDPYALDAPLRTAMEAFPDLAGELKLLQE